MLCGAAAFVSFAPVAARTPEEWLPIVLDRIRCVATGSHRFRSRQPAAGVSALFSPVGSRMWRHPTAIYFGGLDFTNYFLGLTPAASQAPTYDAAKKAGATVGYGTFITVSVNFIIIAFVLFLIIRGINRMMRKEQDAPPPPAPPTKEQVLLTEIRDLLKGRV